MGDAYKVYLFDDMPSWKLTRVSDGEDIFHDSGEPEDQILVRDLAVLVKELNAVAAERDALAERNARILEDVKRLERALDTALEIATRGSGE